MILNDEIRKRIDNIIADRVHGASWLAKEAVQTLGLLAEKSKATGVEGFLRDLKDVGRELIKARPSMASIANSVGHVVYATVERAHRKDIDLNSLKSFAACKVVEAVDYQVRAIASIAETASELIKRKATVMTYSYSSTVLKTLERCKDREIKVIVTESRPLYEGRRTAEELSGFGIPVTLVVDAAVGHHMSEVEIALVGADTVTSDGSVVNKIGTKMVALAAKAEEVPFYAACETQKFEARAEFGRKIVVEEGSPMEVFDLEGFPNIEVRNFYFDTTPPDLVTGIVTEEGIFKPSQIANYSKRFRKYLTWR